MQRSMLHDKAVIFICQKWDWTSLSLKGIKEKVAQVLNKMQAKDNYFC